MLRGDCPAVVRRGGLEAAVDERVHDSFSPFREREREMGKGEEEYILVPVGVWAPSEFQILRLIPRVSH